MPESSSQLEPREATSAASLPAGLSEQRLAAYIAVALIVAVICAYAIIARADFIRYDDTSHVFENPAVTGGLTWRSAGEAFTKPHASLWVPLTSISFMADVSLFGLNPGAMHMVNLFWHAAAAVLLFFTLRRMTRNLWASAFVAALFALHPLNVESVAWITERKNVLCAFFWIAAIAAYARYAERPRALTYGLALFAAALALLSKPMAVTLPFTLLLLDYWPLRRARELSWFRLVAEKLPFFALTIAASLLAMHARRAEALVDFELVTFAGRASNALVSYATYLGQMVWPVNLGIFYPHPVHPQPWLAGGALLFLAAISAAAWRWRKRCPYVLVGWLWFLGTLVPMIGLVQVGSQARADRFTYIPQLGIYLAVTWLVAEFWSRPARRLAMAAGAILLACGLLTARQVSYWLDGATLFEHTIEVTKDNACAYANAGLHRAREGDFAKAIEHFKASLRIQPDQAIIWREFGGVLVRVGRPKEAAGVLREALRREPEDFGTRYQLAVALRESGATEEAIQSLQEMLREVPNSPGLHYHLGLAYAREGRRKEARAHLAEAARLAPNDAKIAEAVAASLR